MHLQSLIWSKDDKKRLRQWRAVHRRKQKTISFRPPFFPRPPCLLGTALARVNLVWYQADLSTLKINHLQLDLSLKFRLRVQRFRRILLGATCLRPHRQHLHLLPQLPWKSSPLSLLLSTHLSPSPRAVSLHPHHPLKSLPKSWNTMFYVAAVEKPTTTLATSSIVSLSSAISPCTLLPSAVTSLALRKPLCTM